MSSYSSIFFLACALFLANAAEAAPDSARVDSNKRGEAQAPQATLPELNSINSDSGESSVPISGLLPQKTFDSISSRANEWSEPSQKSEDIYVLAIRQWLSSLPPKKRLITRKILKDAHPSLHALRSAIRDKKAQLATLSFNHDTSPSTLPRLGKELQELRRTLKTELSKLGERLRKEADVNMGPLGGDGFWLAPPVKTVNESSNRLNQWSLNGMSQPRKAQYLLLENGHI